MVEHIIMQHQWLKVRLTRIIMEAAIVVATAEATAAITVAQSSWDTRQTFTRRTPFTRATQCLMKYDGLLTGQVRIFKLSCSLKTSNSGHEARPCRTHQTRSISRQGRLLLWIAIEERKKQLSISLMRLSKGDDINFIFWSKISGARATAIRSCETCKNFNIFMQLSTSNYQIHKLGIEPIYIFILKYNFQMLIKYSRQT